MHTQPTPYPQHVHNRLAVIQANLRRSRLAGPCTYYGDARRSLIVLALRERAYSYHTPYTVLLVSILRNRLVSINNVFGHRRPTYSSVFALALLSSNIGLHASTGLSCINTPFYSYRIILASHLSYHALAACNSLNVEHARLLLLLQ